jgi:hypothetical protein
MMQSRFRPLTWAAAFLATLSLTSCFKDEPLNAEADIEHVSVHIDNPLATFFNLTDTARDVASTDSTIAFVVRSHADVSSLAPTFRITEGATIMPPSGSAHDFSQGPVDYTVTSEDGHWSRHYTLAFTPTVINVPDTIHFDFEHYVLNSNGQHYYQWFEVEADGTTDNCWSTGNPGFQLSMGSAQPDQYPTYPLSDGHTGSCAALTTRSTGAFGAMVNRRIAAGNLFLGNFNLAVALTNTLHATEFGVPFTIRPTHFKGYYRYTPGTTYQDQSGATVDGREDKGAIYAVLYRNHDDEGNAVVLYGDNVKTSQQIVAIADLGEISATDTWTEFNADFLYRQSLDNTILANRGYSLAVVFSSSNEGDHFEGAVGSTLLIDDVQIIGTTQE